MKGVQFVTNENNEQIAVQIDLETLEQRQDELEDFMDGLLAQLREPDESISWSAAKSELRQSGKM